ncbi:MAG TPA: protein kinase [Gemmatimonadales bacterium]|nr:protein kinase [Gemmatimonadales bacterium]
MSDERWRRVKALFQAAVERPAEERAAFLAAATGDDEALRREVESLLTSDTADTGFLDRMPVANASVLADPFATSKNPAQTHAVLAAGRRVGPYEVVATLGAGGMGEVYRARDTKLRRDVALKVLPERFALDPDRSARFTREAHLLATLNHPNIATIYGLEESGPSTGSGQAAVQALVMELVDGPTLADRIALGPIPVAEALTIARQMADALEAAHEKGIIHRDLKPANIKITGTGVVKVLDFGLAKVWDGGPQSDLSASQKLTVTGLGERSVLGTPAYMSPEQARGQSLDKRTDIWSFGCVLYEMLTGRAPFPGDTISDTLASVLHGEPDWAALPATVPAAVRTLIRRCLEKDNRQRIADISVAQFVLDDPAGVASAGAPGSSTAIAPRPPLWRRLAIPSAAWLIGVVMAGFAVWFAMPSTAPIRVSRTFITQPSAAAPSLDRLSLAVTPDGTRVVYVGANNTALFVRALDQLNATSLTGLGEPYGAFVSPDGQWIGFFEGVIALKKVAITGGPAETLGRPGGTAFGASWGADGTIIFATNVRTTGLLRIDDTGGEPTVLTRPNRAGGEDDHYWPEILPGGQAVLFTITATTRGLDQERIAVLDLQTGTQTVLIRGGSHARYVSSGHLVYAAAGRLHAVAFDLARLAVVGTPVAIQPEVLPPPTSTDAGWAVAADGTLVYVSGGVSIVERSLVWVDRQGQETPIPDAPTRNYAFPRLSPDGRRLAIYIPDQEIDIWLWDLARATLTRATFDPTVDVFPVWRRPDGRQLLFSSVRAGAVNLFAQAADGGGDVTQLTKSPNVQHATSVSPEGTRLVFTETATATGQDVMQLRLDGTQAVTPLVQSPFNERNGEVSPDGRWLAYEANDSGPYNIYVRPFPEASSGYWQVTTEGGTRPLWARNSHELFYLSLTGALMRVGVVPGPTWAATAPIKLFEGRYGAAASQSGRTYDISPDGKRFLMIKPVVDPTAAPAGLVVVQNWLEDLKRLVPTR